MSETEIESLRDALAEQAELQRETDHRIKNNLQLIGSLVLLQGRRTRDEAARQALRAVQQRIAAVSLAHRHIRREGGAERVELSGLLRELASDLAAGAGREDIEIAMDLEAADAPARVAAPLALIANEALVNALAHAFPDGRRGRVSLSLRKAPEGLELAVADDGAGAPEAAADGFGRTIIQLMAQQLRAPLQVTPAQPGTRIAVSVPVDRAEP
ncbi:sensor histidine kinase [Phenylobacterium zucineum]|nr:sensor histidine kinase [Phenylobacterium zucineum]